MATRRKSSLSNTSQDSRNNETVLKMRVEELEAEVARLKGRLDQLRKAKNITILKREREVINVQEPGFNRRDSSRSLTDTKQIELEGKLSESQSRVLDLEKEIKRLQDSHKDELFEMSRKKLEELNKSNKNSDCGHDKEIELLKNQVHDLKQDKAALRFENEELVGRIEEMYEDLSIKEAEWCEKEEKYKKQLSGGWQEKYDQWMQATEQKVEELQSANAFLRTLVKRDKPQGPDPTVQDSD